MAQEILKNQIGIKLLVELLLWPPSNSLDSDSLIRLAIWAISKDNYIEKLLWKYDKNQAEVSEDATLDRSYVGNIVRGRKNDPSRDALIAICLAIGTTVDEVQHLLWYAGHAPLYVRRKRDVIIWFGFMKKRSVTRVNNDLVTHECPELMSKRKLAIDDDD